MKQYDSHKHGRRSIRLRGWDYRSPGYYFVTICTYGRVCLFDELDFREVAANALCRVPEQAHARHVILDKWVVMPNHVHVIIVFVDYPAQADVSVATGDFRNALAGSLGVVVGRYKAAVTTRINNLRGRKGRRSGSAAVMNGSFVMNESGAPHKNTLLTIRRDGPKIAITWMSSYPE